MKENKKLKALFTVLCIVMIVLTSVLIPLNMFVCNFPKWVVTISGIASVGCSIARGILFKLNRITKITMPVVSFILCSFFTFAAYVIPYWNSSTFKSVANNKLGYDDVITYEQAESDMNEAMKHLERIHPMFKNGLTDEIKSRYESSLASLKNMQEITVNDLRREIQVVINPMHDAHTTTHNNFSNDRYLQTAFQKVHDGYSFISVNGITLAELKENAKPYYSYESEAWITIDISSLASYDFYGISEPFTFVWESESGERIVEEYADSDFMSWDEIVETVNGFSEDTQEEKPFVSYDIDEEKSLALLTLTKCTCNDYYCETVKKMFTDVKEKGIKNVAVDLRSNGGGNSNVANEFIRYLPVGEYSGCAMDWRLNFIMPHFENKIKNDSCTELTFNGNAYILTNSQSFSSAMLFPQMIQDNGLGKVIGEPPANNANGYGEVTFFDLKETGLTIKISTKRFYRIDQNNKSDYIIPDFPCDSEDALETLYSVIS